jgi:hypothetical protein
MSYVSIKVLAYSGYRGDERPTSLIIDDKTMKVVEILDRWIEQGFYDRVTKRFFIVKADNNQHYKIFIDETSSEWFYEKR